MKYLDVYITDITDVYYLLLLVHAVCTITKAWCQLDVFANGSSSGSS